MLKSEWDGLYALVTQRVIVSQVLGNTLYYAHAKFHSFKGKKDIITRVDGFSKKIQGMFLAKPRDSDSSPCRCPFFVIFVTYTYDQSSKFRFISSYKLQNMAATEYTSHIIESERGESFL